MSRERISFKSAVAADLSTFFLGDCAYASYNEDVGHYIGIGGSVSGALRRVARSAVIVYTHKEGCDAVGMRRGAYGLDR